MEKPTQRLKVPRIIFDAGCGKYPKGLIAAARRAKETGRNRHFIGIDERIDLDRIVRKYGTRGPGNVELAEACAVRALRQQKPGSIDTVTATYLLNNLHEKSCLSPDAHSCSGLFLTFAARALKPGGRIIIVQDKQNLPVLMEAAKDLGLRFSSIEIPDRLAQKSSSTAVRERSTPVRRLKYLMGSLRGWGLTIEDVRAQMKEQGIKAVSGYMKPVAMIMTKPFEGAEGINRIADKIDKELIPEELIRIIEGIKARQE